MDSNYDSYHNSYNDSCPKNMSLYQPYRCPTMTGNDYTMYAKKEITERYQKGTIERYQKDTSEKYQKDTTERCKRLPSLLKDALLHGKKQNYYYADSATIINMTVSQEIMSSSQTISHNPYQVSPPEYHTSPPKISSTECEQFFGNLQGQQQQQEYNEYSQNYPEHTVQSHNYDFSGPSTISTQYEQKQTKQQTIFNVQESQMDEYRNNNNNIRQRNKNIETPSYNNEQRGPYSSNVADYPWMYKRTSGKSLITIYYIIYC